MSKGGALFEHWASGCPLVGEEEERRDHSERGRGEEKRGEGKEYLSPRKILLFFCTEVVVGFLFYPSPWFPFSSPPPPLTYGSDHVRSYKHLVLGKLKRVARCGGVRPVVLWPY